MLLIWSQNLLLQPFVLLVQVLLNPKDACGQEITWRNAAALDGYVRRLSGIVERLASTNRTLRQWHSVLSDQVGGATHPETHAFWPCLNSHFRPAFSCFCELTP